MKKIVIAPLVAAALVTSALGVSSAPSVANAQSGNSDWYNRWQDNNNYWRSNNYNWNSGNWYNDNNWYDNNNRRISDWEGMHIAQRYMPGRYIVSDEDRWDNGMHERRYRFNDNHCVDVRDDGAVIRIFVIQPR